MNLRGLRESSTALQEQKEKQNDSWDSWVDMQVQIDALDGDEEFLAIDVAGRELSSLPSRVEVKRSSTPTVKPSIDDHIDSILEDMVEKAVLLGEKARQRVSTFVPLSAIPEHGVAQSFQSTLSSTMAHMRAQRRPQPQAMEIDASADSFSLRVSPKASVEVEVEARSSSVTGFVGGFFNNSCLNRVGRLVEDCLRSKSPDSGSDMSKEAKLQEAAEMVGLLATIHRP